MDDAQDVWREASASGLKKESLPRLSNYLHEALGYWSDLSHYATSHLHQWDDDDAGDQYFLTQLQERLEEFKQHYQTRKAEFEKLAVLTRAELVKAKEGSGQND